MVEGSARRRPIRIPHPDGCRSGVQDAALIDRLLEIGVTPATFAALALVPLVAVAWADQRLEDKEKKAVLQEAASSGLQTGSAEYALLEGWLAEQPSPSLMETWAGYARTMSETLKPSNGESFECTRRQSQRRRQCAAASPARQDVAGGATVIEASSCLGA